MCIEADVKKVDSTTHKISVSQSTDEEGFNFTKVALAEEHRFDKDLSLTILPCHPHRPHAVIEQGSAKASDPPFLAYPAITLNYFPDFSSAEAMSELVFVIDQSGSMQGAYIQAAKETLMLFLKSIPDGCHFNIVGFGSSYKFLFKTSVPYDQAHLDKACKHTRAIGADMGGTELLRPLQEVFRMPSVKGLPKQVFVLTDGAVSNTSSVINEVKKNCHQARCFAVGIGSGASTALVRGIADGGRGSSEFVHAGEKMQGKVMRMLKRALTPSLSDVHVNWSLPDGVGVVQAPSMVPPVFSGDRLVIYGFLSNVQGSPEKECRATLTGVCGGNPFETSIPFSFSSLPTQDMNKTIHRLATKCILCDLEVDTSSKVQEMVKKLVTLKDQKALRSKKESIVALSIAANVMCQDTAFIAVDEGSSEPIQSAMQLRQVPVVEADCLYAIRAPQPRGFFRGGKGMVLSKKKKMISKGVKKKVQLSEGRSINYNDVSDEGDEVCKFMDDEYDEDEESDHECNSKSVPSGGGSVMKYKVITDDATTAQGTFSLIVAQQRASGAWQMDSTVAKLLSKSVSEVKMTSPIGKQLTELQLSIWATCIVIAWLEVKCADLKDEWELLVDKAKSWVKKQSLPETLTPNDVIAAAKILF
jgi:hypothetical protein